MLSPIYIIILLVFAGVGIAFKTYNYINTKLYYKHVEQFLEKQENQDRQ